MSSIKILDLLKALDTLKHLKRTGWVKCGVPEPETVACHMYRMAVLAMSLEGQIEGIDVDEVVKMSLVHDLAEAIAGDITPHCGVSEEEKFSLEHEGMKQICSTVPLVGEKWTELWLSYEKQNTLSARVVKQLDKFDMIAQALHYEEKYDVDLEQFFTSTKGVLTMEPFVQWDKEIREKRALNKVSEKSG